MREDHINPDQNLNCFVERQFLNAEEEQDLFDRLKVEIPWFRVKYESERHGNECTTPCWTNFFGGFPDIKPYQPIPSIFFDLIKKVQKVTNGAPYNAVLVRLYFDGQDNIAWHTDGRTFLGDTPTIASLSLGCRSKFEMRKMTNVWPCAGTRDGGVDKTVPLISINLKGGDMLVMQGKTQQSWHHRVPIEKGRGPRININFRYILPGRDETSIRGVRAFYKYMVCGDCKSDDWDMTAKSSNYDDIVKAHGPMHMFALKGAKSSFNGVGKSFAALESNSKPILPPNSLPSNEVQIELGHNDSKDSQWVCGACTFLNSTSTASCEVCEERRGKVLRTTDPAAISKEKSISSFFFKRSQT